MTLDFIDQIVTDLEGIKNIQPSTFNREEGVPDNLANSRGVYVIRQIGGDPEVTYDSYIEHWKGRGKKRYPPPSGNPNLVLYVGKTNKLKKRMDEHLVSASDTTSALRLYEWLEADYRVEVYVFDELSAPLIRVIESSLAQELQPAFGQHGKI